MRVEVLTYKELIHKSDDIVRIEMNYPRTSQNIIDLDKSRHSNILNYVPKGSVLKILLYDEDLLDKYPFPMEIFHRGEYIQVLQLPDEIKGWGSILDEVLLEVDKYISPEYSIQCKDEKTGRHLSLNLFPRRRSLGDLDKFTYNQALGLNDYVLGMPNRDEVIRIVDNFPRDKDPTFMEDCWVKNKYLIHFTEDGKLKFLPAAERVEELHGVISVRRLLMSTTYMDALWR